MADASDVAIDRAKAEPAPPGTHADIDDAELMREELQAVIASSDFARAPIMKRLLSFLANETAAGRGDQLKAYSVAVDGLGRAPDYDARADSYPRVQVGRLRRMLDSYYGATAPSRGLRLAIPSGRYRVVLQPLPADTETSTGAPPSPDLPGRPLMFGWHVAALLLLMLLGAAAMLRVLPMRTAAANAGREPPVLELASTGIANGSELGNSVRATLLNGLARSGMYDLQASGRAGAIHPHAAPARYRLSTDLIEGDRPRLFLRLSRTLPDRLIWSGDIGLPAGAPLDANMVDHMLAPAIATIGRANGVIASHELQENAGLEASGYSCLLLYHRYHKERTDRELEHVRACVDRSLKLDPNDAELQAAATQLAIDAMTSSGTDPRERPALLLTARRHAQISGSIDPLDAWSNIARARVAVLGKACPAAVSFALRASERQPYDPSLLADAGVYLLDCGDARAEGLIRRAIALDDHPDGRFYAILLLLAIARDDQPLAREALARMSPPALGRHGRFDLISAAGYAMVGDIGKARAAWSQLRAIDASVQDPQRFLERLGFSEELRAKAVGHLRRARLIAASS